MHMNRKTAIHTEMSDSLLVERFRSGEHRAFEILLQRWQEPVYRMAWRYIGSSDEAMDISQNTFLKAWTHIDTLEDPGKFGSWVYRICRHQCLDHLKSAHKQRIVAMSGLGIAESDTASEQSLQVNDANTPHSHLEATQRTQIMNRALDNIPEEQKVIIILKEYEGLKFREIADILELPETTVKSRLYYGLKALRNYFSQHNLEQEVNLS
jgi:RNA polymerase sigma-70 factor, ECF subfamily